MEKIQNKQEVAPFGWYYSQGGFWHFTQEKQEWYNAPGVEEVIPLYTKIDEVTDAALESLIIQLYGTCWTRGEVLEEYFDPVKFAAGLRAGLQQIRKDLV